MDSYSLRPRSRDFGRYKDGPVLLAFIRQALVLTVLLGVACGVASAQTMYRMTDLGSLGGGSSYSYYSTGNALNAQGQATGASAVPDLPGGGYHAYLWKNDGTPMQDLGALDGGASEGSAINKSGQVAGDSNQYPLDHAFIWKNDGTPMQDLGTFGGDLSNAAGINDAGQVVGTANTRGDKVGRAFIWKNDGTPIQDLGSFGGPGSGATAINNSGQVTGYAQLANGHWHAFLWKDGTKMQDLGTVNGKDSYAYGINASGQVMGLAGNGPSITDHRIFFWKNDGTPMQELGTFGGGYDLPNAINDSGQITGFSSLPNGDQHAFVWRNDGTPIQDLGTLGGPTSYGEAINNSGQVVGEADMSFGVQRAFLWNNDGTNIQDLNALIDPGDPLKRHVLLTSCDAINDAGQILAEGYDTRTGTQRAYLLQVTGPHGTLLTLAPRALAFGNVPIHTSSATQLVTVTNTSANAVAITNVALRGTAPKQFAFSENCGQSLAAHATCTLKAQFTPSTKGAKTAYLDVNGGGGGLRSVKLTGTGT